MENSDSSAIRQAITAGEYQSALRLWNDYAGSIGDLIRSGNCPRIRLDETGEFLEWARRTVVCAKSQLQNRLNAIHVAERYQALAPTAGKIVRGSA